MKGTYRPQNLPTKLINNNNNMLYEQPIIMTVSSKL